MNTNTRYLFTLRNCPRCREWLKAVRKINYRLPINKRIKIVDAYEYVDFNLKYPPIIKKFEREGIKEGFPYCYIDGIRVEPAISFQLYHFLESMLKEELY